MKILFANKYYDVIKTKELPGGHTSYLIEDEHNHCDWINNPDEVIDYVNLQECYSKEAAVELCKKYNTTVNQVCLENIDGIIDALYKIQTKVLHNETVENEDWINAAIPLRYIMNVMGNHWYIEEE